MIGHVKNNKLIDITSVNYLNYDVQNIEVSNEIYSVYQEDALKVIFLNGEIILNPDYEEEIAQKREATFKSEFFEIPAIEEVFIGGWFRKKPKGYSSAVESLNTAFNMVSVVSSLPADTLLFYTEPDFTDETQCNEEWLAAHSFYNTALTAAQFGQLYTAFMIAWNSEEHEA